MHPLRSCGPHSALRRSYQVRLTSLPPLVPKLQFMPSRPATHSFRSSRQLKSSCAGFWSAGEARRWLAWAHPSELAGALHSRLCLAAEEARREAGIREWELLLQRSRQAGGEGARVACVCVGRMQEAVTPKMEAAVSEACSRLTSGSREIWDIAMVKYRTIANLPLGGRLLLINAIAPDGSCLPPFFCLLPRGALDGYASPARASANTSRQQLAVVLGSNVPRPLLHDDSMASALAAAASAGAAAVAMVAAMSATELIELPGGCWGGSELRAADAVLANTLAELLSHESVECRARGSGDSPPPSPTSVEVRSPHRQCMHLEKF